MITESVAVLGVLFLLVLILAPIIAYFNREKAQEEAPQDGESSADKA